MKGEPMAPEGKIYVCTACGKTARGQYGTQSTYGWDASCMLNSVLANEADLVRGPDGRVYAINGPVEHDWHRKEEGSASDAESA